MNDYTKDLLYNFIKEILKDKNVNIEFKTKLLHFRKHL
jgi:hypothetical protein